MGTGIGCTVYADGEPLADGCPQPGPQDPVVLSGLEIAWGRDTTVDQPEASTCTFEIEDPVRGGSFVDRLRTGTRIDVTATGTLYPDPTEPVWPDPGFETGLPGTSRVNAQVSWSTRRASSGTRSVRIVPVDASRRFTAAIAPAPFSDPGTAPDAWDEIPTTSRGQTWSFGASVFVPPGAVVLLRPILFTGPYPGSGTAVTAATLTSATGDGSWQTLTGSFVPDVDGAWVGLQVSTFPTGLQWDQLPPDMTWDDLAAGTPRVNLCPDPRYIGPDGAAGGGSPNWDQVDLPAGSGLGDGRGCTRLTATADATAVVDVGRDDTAKTAVTPGVTYTASAYARTNRAGLPYIRAYVTWVDAAGTTISSSMGAQTTPIAAGTDYRLSVTDVAPEGAAAAYIIIRFGYTAGGTSNLVTGDFIYVGQRLIEQTDQLLPYFDGNYPDTATITYDWTAEPNASPSTATPVGAWADWSWDDFGSVFVDDVTVLAPAEGTASTVLVYSGRVVSLEASWDDTAPLIKVECVDFTADMENVNVGDEPWNVESMGARFQRILAATGMGVTAEIDASVSGILVSWRDVDSQAATGLLAELAESVDAVMWSATHQVTGPYLRVEDPTNRATWFLLQLVDGVVRIVPAEGIASAMELSACDVLRDDVAWTQDTQDVVTRASVSWQAQGVDDKGKNTLTEKTVTEIDRPLEVDHGVRGLSLSTQLQALTDAQEVARKLLARTSANDWRASGLVIDDTALDDPDEVDITRLLTLLDGTSRNGLALSLTDLPAWSPVGGTVPVYLEGGKYTFEDGAWLLDLTVSNSTGQSASAHWDDLDPAWAWDQFDPAITWNDLRGVGATPALDEGA